MWRIFNIGNNSPVQLAEYVDALEAALGRNAIREYLPLQPAMCPILAYVEALTRAVGHQPATPVCEWGYNSSSGTLNATGRQRR